MTALTFSSRLLLAALVVAASAPAWAQGVIDRDHVPSDERVDLFERRQTDLDANVVRTTVFNFGQTGRTSAAPDEIPYEWPRNTRRHYLALTGLFAGAEVVGESGEREWIVDVPNYRTNLNNPSEAWTWAPVQGYVNTADEDLGIARSDRPETWPAFWPDKTEDPTDPGWAGSWSGLFGKDVFNADLEVYYKMGDDEYAKPNNTYYPDETDRSRRGLGLLADTRVLAWSQVLIDDVVFILHKVKNDGTKDLSTVGVTLWLADLVGGDPDASDDQPFFDLLLDTAFLADADGRSTDTAFEGAEVEGAIAFFLETPGNATDRIDNDGDGTTAPEAAEFNFRGVSKGEPGGPIVTLGLLAGEGDQAGAAGRRLRYDGIDNNGNGLIDEDSTQAAFGTQVGVGFADYIDNDGDGEPGSPVVTQAMIDAAAADVYGRWPVNPNTEAGEPVHLIGVGVAYGVGDTDDLGKAFRDNIDNDGDAFSDGPPPDFLWEPGSPVVTQEMVNAAASDAPYYRYAVPGTDIVLYDVKAEDVGSPYADGVDNDGDGAIDEGIDEDIDEMIDERRDDGIDNDGDWRAALDDVGLDGSGNTVDTGEGDGVPTSGAGTDLPGEPNLDVTDVSESDQIGITNVQYKPAGGVNYQSIADRQLFFDFMVPGQFSLLQPGQSPASRDTDLFVSSGTFPLRAGQTESVSFAVILGDVDYGRQATDVEGRYRDLLTKRQDALEAYEADYRFAQAPICPTVRAVPGDGAVTLYWDDAAESSFDTFIADLAQPGLDPRDFEGYRVYRATDPGFLDARQITDGFGNVSFLRPIAQFDLIDAYEGFHPVATNGTQFYLGSNVRDPGEAANGLVNTFTDSTAVNGVQYYYAVTSYDFGAATVNIQPSECPISITIGPDGTVTRTGPNVSVVTPSQAAAGYTEGTAELTQTQGFASGSVAYRTVDPTSLRDGHRYRVTFRDTLILGQINTSGRQITQDTIRTRDVTLVDVTDGRTLFANSTAWRPERDAPITDGFQLSFDPVFFTSRIADSTRWQGAGIKPITADVFSFAGNPPGTRVPADYRIEVGPPGSGMSTAFALTVGIPRTLPAKPTNVRVFKTVVDGAGNATEVPVAYAFYDVAGDGASPFEVGSAATNLFSTQYNIGGAGIDDSDRIYLLEDIPGDRRDGLTPTWEIRMSLADPALRDPQPGDTGVLVTSKPFLASDVYEFTVTGPSFDADAAAGLLDQVRVVPNPYRGTSQFEVANPFPTGRGERRIRFVGLPPQATVRIFTPSGRLVRTLEMNEGSNGSITTGMLLNGSLSWDLLNEDRLEVSYGVYLYHVEAPGVGETTGTLALIK
ncbi:hypothetical protein [Rubrivirga marina]|uniref:FlgD Ig-like domain-containing protein n=1 Tax=Rubrivirga marina TaxID=1196024 RepID=A0A271J0T3_9BACT|nr:hypothetical protein [Rubrivirga marina]PAP76565.1 hypothetical protein BSZ37_08980 [Rubrivirga marina]